MVDVIVLTNGGQTTELGAFTYEDLPDPPQVDIITISPAQGLIEPQSLAEWILEDGLDVRFQLQLHKLLWGNMQGK